MIAGPSIGKGMLKLPHESMFKLSKLSNCERRRTGAPRWIFSKARGTTQICSLPCLSRMTAILPQLADVSIL